MHSGHDRTSESLALSSGIMATDTLSNVLHTVRMTGALFFVLECTTPWVDEVPEASTFSQTILPGAQQLISYHIITQGHCWGGLTGSPPVRLEAGDILLLPHGDPYVLSSAPGLRTGAPVETAVNFFRQMAAGGTPFRFDRRRWRTERRKTHLWFSGLRCASLQSRALNIAPHGSSAPGDQFFCRSFGSLDRIRCRRIAGETVGRAMRPPAIERIDVC